MFYKTFGFLFIYLIILISGTLSQKEIDSSNEQPVIEVFLVPHSHCDVGWLKTVEQYYTENVTLILNNVIETLTKDKSKKFNWAEM